MTVEFTVEEHAGKEQLNTPGGAELKKRLGGEGQGLPFFAFLNAQGEPIVNSIEPPDGPQHKGGNVGFPAAPNELAWFGKMLEKAAPAMSAAERATLDRTLRTLK